mgnify:FL=1
MKFALCYNCWGKGYGEIEDYGYYTKTKKCSTCRGTGRIPREMIGDLEGYRKYIAEHCLELDGLSIAFADVIKK